MQKKLYRSVIDKKLCGVCGGLGDYFEIDSTLVRLLWVILAFISCGAALLGYLICAIIVPSQPQSIEQPPYTQEQQEPQEP